MIAIIDYGMGNLKSIYKAMEYLGAKCYITSNRNEILSADGLILPGVGAFGKAVERINESGILDAIKESVSQKKPFLGICLGMQLMFEKSLENGEHSGIGFLKGRVDKITGVKVPHMGWNEINIIKKDEPLLQGIDNPVVYFVHSYHCVPADDVVSSVTDYGSDLTASVWKDNVHGLQFHPEKSGATGLKILDNFRRIVK